MPPQRQEEERPKDRRILDRILEPYVISLASTFLACVLLLLDFRNRRLLSNLHAELEGARHQIARFVEYGKLYQVLETKVLDVILLGPRNSGKTSLCEKWHTPWTEVKTVKATTEDFDEHLLSVYEGSPQAKMDELFGIARKFVPHFRLRILDYAGEDHLKEEALARLTAGPASALMLMFTCTTTRKRREAVSKEELRAAVQENAAYFNLQFLEGLEQSPVLRRVRRVFVVFNKIDVLPPNWTCASLESAHQKVIDALRRVFNDRIEISFISSEENTHTINLLGSLAKLLLDTDVLPPEVHQKLQSGTMDPTPARVERP
jgi:GTPase SAR1 family protein